MAGILKSAQESTIITSRQLTLSLCDTRIQIQVSRVSSWLHHEQSCVSELQARRENMGRNGILQARRTSVLHEAVDVRPASSRDELEKAYRLVYQSYLRRGYLAPDPDKIRVTAFNALPGTATFTSVVKDSVVATVSLVPDTPAQLPMDAIYHDKLQALRDSGRRLCEVTMLADRRVDIRRTLPMLLRLMKLVFDYTVLVLKATDLCITINPRHDDFYRRYLLFTPLGELRRYPSVRNNPALARRLDLVTVRERCKGNDLLQRLFYENRTPVPVFQNRYKMTSADLAYFLVEVSPALRDAPKRVLGYLRAQYPQCPWDEWRSISGAANEST